MSNRADGCRKRLIEEGIIVDLLEIYQSVEYRLSPELTESRRSGSQYRVVVSDALNPLRAAEVSLDAQEWRSLRPEDGILDGKRETLQIDAPTDAALVLLRLTDAAFNVVTYDLRRETR